MSSELETNGMVPGHNPVVPNSDPDLHHEHGAKVEREAGEGRKGMIEKLFSSYQAARTQAKAEATAIHSPEWSGYESRSVLLQKNAAYAPKSESLTDRVRSLLGRR